MSEARTFTVDVAHHMTSDAPLAIRLLHDPPLDGPANMARDEALLVGVGRGESPPTLRLYQWDPPTISLGYFQPYAEAAALAAPAGGLAVVRRTTGGGAILHDLELTYSLTLPAGHALLHGGPNALYEIAHDAVIACFARHGVAAWRGCESDGSSAGRGPFFCFARRHCFDVMLGDNKLAGSAQRRTPQAVLQHGSIMTGRRFAQQPTADPGESPEAWVPRLVVELPQALARLAGLAVAAGAWRPGERARAEELWAKYAGEAWTRRV